MLSDSNEDEQFIAYTPRYAEHFVRAAALVGAFGLVFGAMALGAWLLFRTTLVEFKFFRELIGPVYVNTPSIIYPVGLQLLSQFVISLLDGCRSPKKQTQAQIQHEIAHLRVWQQLCSGTMNAMHAWLCNSGSGCL